MPGVDPGGRGVISLVTFVDWVKKKFVTDELTNLWTDRLDGKNSDLDDIGL